MHLKNQEQMSHRKVYIETYGCQMNVNDTEVIFSILAKAGYERTENMEEADVLMNEVPSSPPEKNCSAISLSIIMSESSSVTMSSEQAGRKAKTEISAVMYE